MINLNEKVEVLPYIGEVFAKKLSHLKIETVNDLIYHIPHRFEDTALVSNIADINQEGFYTVKGNVVDIESIYTRNGKKITRATIEDDTGLANILWFNQPYISNSIPSGSYVLVYGKVSFEDLIRPKFISPSYEKITESNKENIGTLTAIYPETKGISSKWLRARIQSILGKIELEEWLPKEILSKYKLLDINTSIQKIHLPKDTDEYKEALKRIAFDEMLLIQLLMEEKRNIKKKDIAQKINFDDILYKKFIKNLSFTLTKSQKTVIQEILNNIKDIQPMNRLLHGEVGSGKTVVAAAIIDQVINNGYKVSLMTPTTILAKQHYNTLKELFTKLGNGEEMISLVTNKSKPNKESKIYIGTQALLFKENLLDEVALTIIDEQHRFGVSQREKLKNINNKIIHSLTMTATPIPRTLALSIYGDLDISYIDELPSGRQKIVTKIVPQRKRDDLYEFIKENVKNGRQAFIICPLIGLSDKLNVKSAEEEFHRLKSNVFKRERLVLLHGQMKAGEKDIILEDFKNKKYDILISTPVVEVGIDIPNANIMVIEGAERFGLAQLHQLRGRVGRGTDKSFCFLLTSDSTSESKERLKVFTQNESGLKIAEFDLQNRGPGEVYGVKQSGIPNLKAASLMDIELITDTKKLANEILKNGIDKYDKIKDKLKEFKHSIESLN